MKIKGSQKSMRGLRLVGEEENGNAFSLYGPVKAGLTTTPNRLTQKEGQDQVLSELLNSLESRLGILESKYSEVLDTLISALDLLVRLGDIIKEQGITSATQD